MKIAADVRKEEAEADWHKPLPELSMGNAGADYTIPSFILPSSVIMS